MRENTLLKLALICSLVGLAALFFISRSLEIDNYKPGLGAGSDVKVSGKIQEISARDGVAFITLDYETPIEIVLFTKETVGLKENDYVEVTGKIDEYRGKEEIIAQKIVVKK